MNWYRYQGFNSEGKKVSGRLHASDRDEVASLLQEQGIRIERIEEEEESELAFAAQEASETGVTSRLSARDFEVITDHLSDLTRARLPLSTGLEAVSFEIENTRLRTAVQDLATQLESGSDLETVLANSKAPRELCALVHAGSRSGKISEILADYVAHARQLAEMRSQLLMALCYPLVLMLFASLMFLAIMLWIIPSFESIFLDFGIELPAVTNFMFVISTFIRTQWWWYLPGSLCLLLGCVALFRTETGQALGQRILFRLPLIGGLLSGISVSRFSHLLALLVDNEVPFLEALKLTGESSNNYQIRKACRQFSESVSSGEMQIEALSSLKIFPATFLQTLATQSGNTAHSGPRYSVEILNALADMLNGQTRVRITFFATVVEPVIIIVCAVTMGFLFISLLAPLFKLLTMLS
ncbi:type II secretion system F family protein [Gimesia panareensis]|uniref:Type II secretion system protein F n=1 Tax=Gimesia panareensis TaxID=2527978 RepID=A0A517PZQ4_9PLAN|nr:type II secretion system F family protein [Gimesia panareensis]QDT24826.1 Type II secretion system protein F [Gimesia panareensis]QDU47771.1 Type II secretion system protein F [Gimesia panareensis]